MFPFVRYAHLDNFGPYGTGIIVGGGSPFGPGGLTVGLLVGCPGGPTVGLVGFPGGPIVGLSVGVSVSSKPSLSSILRYDLDTLLKNTLHAF